MPRGRLTPEQIIQHLRDAEVLLSQDEPTFSERTSATDTPSLRIFV